MNALLVFAILFAALFFLSYITKRRFGVLGLALCAGSLLSASWTATLTPMLQGHGISTTLAPMSAMVATLLTLLPALILLFSGPTYSNKIERLVGSLAFALLAFVLLLGPIGAALVLDPFGYQIYTKLSNYSNMIIVAGIALAIGDVLFTRSSRHHERR